MRQESVPLLDALAAEYAARQSEPLHAHPAQAQLKWPGAVAVVRTAQGAFVLPPRFALWIPAGVMHGGIYRRPVRELSLYLRKRECRGLPSVCCSVHVTPELEAALRSSTRGRRGSSTAEEERDAAVVDTLRREVVDAGLRPLPIQLPSMSRVQSVIDALLAQPELDRPSSAWAAHVGVSPSTFSRTFRKDTGLSFGAWRKRARLLHALQRLAAGLDVTHVANELDYRPSAFVKMFRATLGTTPGKYYARAGDR